MRYKQLIPNHLTSMSNLASLFPIYYCIITGKYYLATLFLASAAVSFLYHIVEMNTGMIWSHQLQGIVNHKMKIYESYFLQLDRIICILILLEIINIYGSIQSLITFLSTQSYISWLIGIATIILIISEFLTGWNYAIWHSVWHIIVYIMLGLILKTRVYHKR